jgi:hypothetical protein
LGEKLSAAQLIAHPLTHPYPSRIKERRCFVLLSEEVVSLEARAEEDFQYKITNQT